MVLATSGTATTAAASTQTVATIRRSKNWKRKHKKEEENLFFVDFFFLFCYSVFVAKFRCCCNRRDSNTLPFPRQSFFSIWFSLFERQYTHYTHIIYIVIRSVTHILWHIDICTTAEHETISLCIVDNAICTAIHMGYPLNRCCIFFFAPFRFITVCWHFVFISFFMSIALVIIRGSKSCVCACVVSDELTGKKWRWSR